MQNGKNEDENISANTNSTKTGNESNNNEKNEKNDKDIKDIKEKNERKDDNHFIMKALAQFTQLGITMASCVIIGLLIGKFFDWLLGTAPWFMIIFAFIGSGASLKVLYDIGKDWK